MAKGYIVDTWDSEFTARQSGYYGPLEYLDTGAVRSEPQEFECRIPYEEYLEAKRLDDITADEMRAKMNDTIRQAPSASFDIEDHTAVKTDEAGGYLHRERFTYER